MSRTDYKLCTFHGTLLPSVGSSEAKLRNFIYLVGNLLIQQSRSLTIPIRVIGYEIPLDKKFKRMDAIGYDKDFNLWIIELKAENSTEKLDLVMKQVEDYSKYVIANGLTKYFEREIYERYFFTPFKLNGQIKKMILAPREYLDKNKGLITKTDPNLFICQFSKTTNYETLLHSLSHYPIIKLSQRNK
jgi:hypothetical protein